jgi:hypothetical protein
MLRKSTDSENCKNTKKKKNARKTRIILTAFCPSKGKSAANDSGGGTPFMDDRLPDNTTCIINVRDVCRLQGNGTNCALLDDNELLAASTKLRTLANDATKVSQDAVFVNVGGVQSDRYVKKAALECPCFSGGRGGRIHLGRAVPRQSNASTL